MTDSTINLKDAKARLSELVERAQAGETVTISRRGKVVAQLTASPAGRKPIDLEALRALTRRLPRSDREAGDLMREIRDDARY
jgi:prevent-host-death family protein